MSIRDALEIVGVPVAGNDDAIVAVRGICGGAGPRQVQGASVSLTLPIFTAAEAFGVGKALGSPVAMGYHRRTPFEYTPVIKGVHIAYI